MWDIFCNIDDCQTLWCSQWHNAVEHDNATAENNPLQRLCLANFDLWHEEDKARDSKADDRIIANVKRNIDKLNQKRNDAIEFLDCLILRLWPCKNNSAELNSETPGSMADRLFINSLRIFHMEESLHKSIKDKDEKHTSECQSRIDILKQQRSDLLSCLYALYNDCITGKKLFKVYRQLKMYNDSRFNKYIASA